MTRMAPAALAAGLLLASGLAGPALAAPSRSEAASAAAFAQMATVMMSPRCMNCHTAANFPRQGDDRHPHLFGVSRGPANRGPDGLRCVTCHGLANNTASGVPGAEEAWRLAPLSMAWEHLSPAQLCRLLKDPKRNGGRTGAAIVDHLHTHLVMWAWSPGADIHGQPRTLPPLSYADFIRAAETWTATGEACPAPRP